MHAKTLVKSLRGSSGQVLWAFYFAWHAMDVNEVMAWTNLKRETCYQALNSLEGEILATQILAHGRKVWLLSTEILPVLRELATRAGDIQVIDADSETSGGIVPDVRLTDSLSVKRTSGVVVVVDSDLDLKVPTITTTTTTTRDQMSVKRTSGDQGTVSRSPAEWAALVAALKEHRIIGSKRRALIECEWVTGEYVHRTVKHTIGERIWDQPVGMAINRMLEGLPAPEKAEKKGKQIVVDKGKRGIEVTTYTFDVDQAAADFTGHANGCKCMDCTVYRSGGERMLCPDCKHYHCECEDK